MTYGYWPKNQQTVYQWIVESVDKHGDVIEVYHFDKLKDALEDFDSLKGNYGCVRADVALRRDVYQWEDLAIREYNYIRPVDPDSPYDEHIDTHFNDGHKVPNRFMKEINRIFLYPDFLVESLKLEYDDVEEVA